MAKNLSYAQKYLEELIQAIQENDLDSVKNLVENNDVCLDDKYGHHQQTPLHYAVRVKTPEIAEYLLSKNADPNIQDRSLETPLHYCAKRKLTNFTEILLAAQANTGIQNKSKETPLHLASTSNNLDQAHVLLEHDKGRFINLQDTDGYTPLHHAVFLENADLSKKLYEYGALTNIPANNGHTPFSLSFLNKDLLKFFIYEAGAQLNSTNHPPLQSFAKEGDLEGFEILRQYYCDPNIRSEQDHKTPLETAIESNQVDFAIELINNGARFDLPNPKTGLPPFHVAAATKNIEILNRMVEINPESHQIIDSNGATALHHSVICAVKDDLMAQTISFLIKNGFDPNQKDSTGQSPLNIAMVECTKPIFDALIKPKPDPNNNTVETKKDIGIILP